MECRRAAAARCLVACSAAWLGLVAPATAGAVNIAVLAAAASVSQIRVPATGSESVFLRADRITLQRLGRAREAIEQRRFDDAARYLGTILETHEDYFFRPDAAAPFYRSLKAEAHRLIGEMPSEGRASYELQYGATAHAALDEAVAAGDMARLAAVSRQFFHTQAGYEATLLLGVWNMDHGQPMAAALCFDRLRSAPSVAQRMEPELSLRMAICSLRAGMEDEARRALVELKQRSPSAEVDIGGKARRLFDRDDVALAWLAQSVGVQSRAETAGGDDWRLFRGDAARNAQTDEGRPLLNRRWAAATCDDPYISQLLDQLRRVYAEQDLVVLPAMHPLVVRDHAFIRTLTSLVAVDMRTGKRIWKGAVDDSVREMLESGGRGVTFGQSFGQSSVLATWLGQRVWNDATYGTISSDGERVFCVEDLGTGISAFGRTRQNVVLPNGQVLSAVTGARSNNRLAAYDIATEGKLQWELGGQLGEGALPLAGAFFLGPPLPLDAHLYVLAEIKGEVRLLALDAKTGTVEWSQQLALLATTIDQDPARRTSGVTPSYADGVLVCPTSAGAVVGVDLTSRSLLWGYEYPMPADSIRQQAIAMRMIRPGFDSGAASTWHDGSVTIADGRVLVTPRESDELHCLRLVDGSLEWSAPRIDGLYVAFVADGVAVVVGAHSLHAYSMSDGSHAWETEAVDLPDGSAPSGRGFFDGKHYFLPLTTAEVATIDVATGRIVERTKAPSGAIPGNLVCYGGSVVSQSLDSVESFRQIDDLRRQVERMLAADADDAEALALHGELLLDAGELPAAIDALRRSYAARRDPRTRGLLVSALLAGLEHDFAAHRTAVDELETLVEDDAERIALMREAAAGLQELGEWSGAFSAYARIIDQSTADQPMTRVSDALAVRTDRWVRARLSEIERAAADEDRKRIDAEIAARLDRARKSVDISELERFVDYFDGHALADAAREALAERLASADRTLAAERLLRRLCASDEPAQARAATANLFRLLVDLKHRDDAQPYADRLARQWADVECLDGKTGRQILAEVAGHGDVQLAGDAWPQGNVKVTKEPSQAPPAFRNFPVEIRGEAGPYYSRMSIEFDQPKQALVGRDGLGRERWRVPLVDRSSQRIISYPQTASHARVDGYLVLVLVGYQLLAIDTLGTRAEPSAKILWRHDLIEAIPGTLQYTAGMSRNPYAVPWGLPRIVPTDAQGRPIHFTLAGSNLVVFQRGRQLLAVEADSGEIAWTRQNAAPGSEAFGDDEMVFVSAPNQADATVYRALDGEELGHRAAPPVEQRMTTLGRQVATWSNERGKNVASLVDAWTGAAAWRVEFDGDAKPWLVGTESLGVVERGGRFRMIDLRDGSTTIDAKITHEPLLDGIFVFRTPTRDVLIANRRSSTGSNRSINSVPGGAGGSLVYGVIYGFDRATGRQVFSTKVDGQGLTWSQAADLPVLVFASNQMRTQTRPPQQELAITCLDKRTGRIVFDERMINNANSAIGVDVVGDPQRREVSVRTAQTTIRLTFTDDPVAIKPKAAPPAAKRGSGMAAVRALWRVVEQSAGALRDADRNFDATIDRGEDDSQAPAEDDDDE